MPFSTQHQYIDRATSQVRTEPLYGDSMLKVIYSTARERSPALFKVLTSRRFNNMLSFLNFDMPLGARIIGGKKHIEEMGVDLSECIEEESYYNTPLRLFERQIRFWESRPMDDTPDVIVSPADSKMLVGSFGEISQLFIKEKFFEFDELISPEKKRWLEAFEEGDFAVCRLTPEKYHHNHFPVSGNIVDLYEIDGAYNSCNPGAVASVITPYSKNKRIVTVIDTDVEGGSCVGLVAMIEVVALMIGDIVQCYSDSKYDNPRPLERGMYARKGCVKSKYLPGSSVDVLIFQAGRIAFEEDIIQNLNRVDATSRFSVAFGRSLVETDVDVRGTIAHAV